MIDINIPRSNQAVVALLTGAAFVFSSPLFTIIAFTILAISRFGGPSVAPVSQAYVRVVRPRLSNEIVVEDARPPAFAQLIGTVMLGVATVAFLVGASSIGYALTLVVSALAALAAVAKICVGCLLYERFSESSPA